MGHKQMRTLVHGAMIAAIFGVLSLFNTYSGSVFDIFICYAMVSLFVWYGYTYTFKDHILTCLVSLFVVLMSGLPFFFISSIATCVNALWIAEALKHQAQKTTIMLGTLAVTFLNNLCLYEIFADLLGMNLIAEMKEMYMMMESVFPTFFQSFSLNRFLALAPLMLLLLSFLEMYVIVLLCQLILPRLKIPFPHSFHIMTLHFSKRIGVLSVGSLVIGLMGGYVEETSSFLWNDLWLIGFVVLALEGVAFLSWLSIVYGKRRWSILVWFGFLLPYINALYVVIGIIDIFSDLRENILYNKHEYQTKEGKR